MGTKAISTHAAAAKLIRAELKKNGIAGRVRARTASMMTAVDVDVVDLAPWTRRELEAYVGQFEYGHFDGMDDSYHYSNRRDDLPQVKYAHVHNKMSDELRAEIEAWIESYFAPGHDLSAWQIFNDDRNFGRGFWQARKPRVRLAS